MTLKAAATYSLSGGMVQQTLFLKTAITLVRREVLLNSLVNYGLSVGQMFANVQFDRDCPLFY